MRLSGKRRWLLSVIVTLAACFGYAYQWKWSRRPVRREFTTQRPGESRHVWRAMRVAWTFHPGPKGTPWAVNDLFGDETRLFYSSDCEAGCLDPDTGQVLWRYPFVSHGVAQTGPTSSQDTNWRLTRSQNTLIACECQSANAVKSYDPFRVCALDIPTGKERWSVSFLTPPVGPVCPAGPLLLVPNVDGTVKALRQKDGVLIWQQRMSLTEYYHDKAPLYLAVSGGIGVARIGGGHLRAFRVEDGKTLWQWPFARKEAREAENPNNGENIWIERGVVYAILDGSEAVALDQATGRLLWRRESNNNGNLNQYLPGTTNKLLTQFSNTNTALNAANGKTLWGVTYGESISVLTNTTQIVNTLPEPLSFSLPTPKSPHVNKIETTDRTDLTYKVPSANNADTSDSDRRPIYLASLYAPLIDRVPRLLRSVPEITTLRAIDSETGREMWRWQPTRNMQFDKIVVGKHRLYFSDNTQIVAAEDGFEEPMPDNPRERWMLARHLLSTQYGWPPDPNDFMRRFARWLSPPTSPQMAHLQEERLDEYETRMALLSLGENSVIPLVEFIHHAVTEHEQNQQLIIFTGSSIASDMIGPLDLLFDLNDRSVIPSLIAELERATQPGTRDVLAQSLIWWGDMRALCALFRYAQSPTAVDGTRENALYFVCQHNLPSGITPAQRGLPPDAPTRNEVTAWLQTRLQDRRTPNCLYTYAKFELLNDRGETARRAALATFHCEKRAHLLPLNPVLMLTKPIKENDYTGQENAIWQESFPDTSQALAVAQEKSGRKWAAFRCHYFGPQEHIWFAQSEEGKWTKRWRRAAFGVNLTERCTQGSLPTNKDYKLTCAKGILHLKWREITLPDRKGQTREIRHTEHIPITSLYQDSDGDGIPDRAEKELGLDPYRADTNQNGLSDGTDKNPLYRPHPLTEQEAIYQAVVEALCQLGRSMPVNNGQKLFDDVGTPAPFGRGAAPLLLPAPPGSAGVEVRGHSGMVFCRPAIAHKWSSIMEPGRDTLHFTPPFIGLNGSWHGPQQEETKESRPADPFVSTPATNSPSPRDTSLLLKDYFPIVLSPDKKRARIGFQSDAAGRWGGQIGFDVEVRKQGGRWLPVECRRVYRMENRARDSAVVPIYNRSDKTELQQSWRYGGY